jgi:hypothetical protein
MVTQASRSAPSGRLAALSRHCLARSLYRSGFQLSGMKHPLFLKFQTHSFQPAEGSAQIQDVAATEPWCVRLRTMDARELRQRAMHYRQVAGKVSDEAVANALLELAAEYDSLADRLDDTEPTPGATEE